MVSKPVLTRSRKSCNLLSQPVTESRNDQSIKKRPVNRHIEGRWKDEFSFELQVNAALHNCYQPGRALLNRKILNKLPSVDRLDLMPSDNEDNHEKAISNDSKRKEKIKQYADKRNHARRLCFIPTAKEKISYLHHLVKRHKE